MNFLREHLGPLMGGGAFGLGATFLLLFKEMIRDTWNAVLFKFRQSRPASLQAPVGRREADALGVEVTHQLMAILTQDLADRKSAEEKNWTILKDLLETVKTLTNNVGSLQAQASSQTTLMGVIAGRSH